MGASARQETEAPEEEWEALIVLAIFINKAEEKIMKEKYGGHKSDFSLTNIWKLH